MGELVLDREQEVMERARAEAAMAAASEAGRMTVLEALAEDTEGISINSSHRSTQMGNGVDAEDD